MYRREKTRRRVCRTYKIYTVAYHVINFRTVMFNGLSARSFCCLIQTSEDKQLSEKRWAVVVFADNKVPRRVGVAAAESMCEHDFVLCIHN